jgi:two-component system, OmpR family, sensor histidine kinase TctE
MSLGRATLRAQLLRWLLIPLAVVGVVYAVITQVTVEQTMNRTYDQSLYASALAISKHIAFAEGRLIVDLPSVALEMLDTRDQERIFYRVSYRYPGQNEVFVTGYSDLPGPPDEAPPGTPMFYQQFYRGEAVRLAALRALPPADQPVEALIEVGVTVRGRNALTDTLVGRALGLQVLLILFAGGLVWFAVRRGLTPLRELSREVTHRSATDLEPLQLQDVPEEVSPLIEAINQLIARVRDAIAGQRRFIADASHQLRTPLAVLRTQAELALRQEELGSMKDAVAQVRDCSQATSHLASQLLSLARAEPATGTDADAGLVDLNAVAREACSALVPEALSRRMDLGFEGNGPATIRGRRYLVREMIANLVDNAMRYGAPGGTVTVSVAKPEPGSVRLSVEDDGPGIPSDERGHVFERFYRIPGSAGEGAGLGLSIVREIARGHGATVRLLDRRGGRGLRVEVVFPSKAPA